jgi:hypothetical protein
MVQEPLDALAQRLGHHHPGLVVQEAVDHHPVKAGQAGVFQRRSLAQRPEADRSFEGQARRLKPRQHSGRGDHLLRRGLQFEG